MSPGEPFVEHAASRHASAPHPRSVTCQELLVHPRVLAAVPAIGHGGALAIVHLDVYATVHLDVLATVRLDVLAIVHLGSLAIVHLGALAIVRLDVLAIGHTSQPELD